MNRQTLLRPDIIFESSWEVCNKVGGIYTVLASRAKSLWEEYGDNLVFIGPDLWKERPCSDFREDQHLLRAWRNAATEAGIPARIGRWTGVEGKPVAILVDINPFYEKKNEIYTQAWHDFGIDSLNAYGDYDEASMFSYAAARFVEAVYLRQLRKNLRVVYQAHEWMTGLGMLHLSKAVPAIATIFTTHATSIGRSIAGNGKSLYKYFHGYDGDQMAAELHMQAKHSVEKQSALRADCFTTVSTFTDRECRQLLGKQADVILPNGFDSTSVPTGSALTRIRRTARRQILKVASALLGEQLTDNTLIVSTSGRNDYRCKGFDVYLEALAQLNARLHATGEQQTRILALIEVPCWTRQPRTDLQQRLVGTGIPAEPLPHPFITHELNNYNEDRLVNTIRGLALWNQADDPVKVMLIPCYLDGQDGIVNLHYYNALAANDLCIYPSYYEPWGYTPLEACAYHIPCITTDLSGFGQWVDNTLGHKGQLSDGVAVLHRDDDNYFSLASNIADAIQDLLQASVARRNAMRKKAATLASKAQWSSFIQHYYEAYHFALQKKQKK